MKKEIEYEFTPYYKEIPLPKKAQWVDYFRVLYNERDQVQERLTHEVRDRLLKERGFDPKEPDIYMCLTGQSPEWNALINGFFRHYHSTIYREYCAACHHYDGLFIAQFEIHKDFGDLQKKTQVLKELSVVRQIKVSLEKELYNTRHGEMGTIVPGHNAFKGTVVEQNAARRTRTPKSIRQEAEDYD